MTPLRDDRAYRPDVDGLRAIAVLAVIVGHVDNALLPSGHLGVDVFFVISGFVITSSLCSRQDLTFSAFVANFYIRRIKRLLPALVACVAATGLAISLFDPSPGASLKTGLTSLFGVSNVFLLWQATDYFGKPAQLNAFMHTWSLGVEEQFYLLFPLLLWSTALARAGSMQKFTLVIGVLSAASLVAFGAVARSNEAAAFFLMPTRFWELGVGALAFAAVRQGGPVLTRLRALVPPLVWIVVLLIVFAWPAGFSVSATVAAVAATALLILSLEPGRLGHALLAHRWTVYVGLISYSLYLWHWSVLSISRWTVGVDGRTAPFQLALMFLLAALSYRYLELPLRRARWGVTPARTFAYGAVASLGAGALLGGLGLLKGQLYVGERPPLMARGVESLIEPYRNPEKNLVWLGGPCVISDNRQAGTKTIPIEGCTLGNFEDARRRVLVVGSSFSPSFVRGFDDLVAKDGYAVTITAAWGGEPGQTSTSEASKYYWSTQAPMLMGRLRSGDALFVILNLDTWLQSKDPVEALDVFRSSMDRTARELRPRNVSIYVLHALPPARQAGCEPDMAAPQWFSPFGRPCRYYSRADALARRAPVDRMLAVLSRDGKVRVIDLFDVFCPGATCTFLGRDGEMLYRDSLGHPSVEAAMLAAPVIRRALLKSGQD